MEREGHHPSAESTAFAQAVLDASADGIVVLDADGFIVRSNPAAAELLGVPEPELEGEHFGTLASAPAESGPSTLQVLRTDGSTRTVELRSAVTAWAGSPVTVVSIRDISERLAADLLRRRLLSIIDATPNLVGIMDPTGGILYLNRAGRDLLELEEGTSASDLRLEDIHCPESFERIRVEGIPAALRDGLWSGESTIAATDGRRVPVWQAILAHRSSEGDLEYLSTVIQDLTEWKAAEEALRERVKELRTLYQATREIARADRSLEERLGQVVSELPDGFLEPANTRVRLSWGDRTFESPGFRSTAWVLSRPIVSRGHEVGTIDVALVQEREDRGEGSGPFLPEEGELLSALATVIAEAIERERLQSEFVQAQKMETIGRLAGGAAHDFNNLLAVVQGHAEIALLDLPESASARGDLEQILRAAGRGASLTGQLLAFSRTVMLEEQVLDLRDAVREIQPMLRRVVPSRIEVRPTFAPVPCTVRLDPARLDQVLLNLVINAADAIEGHGTITVAVDSVEDAEAGAGPSGRVLVADTGAGIAPELTQRIFEPFFTTKPRGRGTGLGLSMVYGFVQQSGGRIAVESNPGEGTTIELAFPLLPDAEAAHSAAAEPGGREVDHGRTGMILVVDDDDGVRRVLVRILTAAGHTVFDADNGEAAIEVLQANRGRVDIVLTDVVMPKLGGVDLIDRIAEMDEGLVCIVMSGHSELEIGERLRTRQTAFLSKPFSRDEVLRAVALRL